MSRSEDGMTQLETKLAFLEDTVEVLAGELEAQQNETRTLNKKLVRLMEQLEGLQHDAGVGEGQDEPPPPHY